MRILFLGTPEFAVPTLKELIAHQKFDVVAVVTQPDRPAGRGNKVHEPPTKVLALQHGVRVFQPESLSKEKECVEELKKLEPDYAVMVAFGQILKKSMLQLPKHGIVNIHASLLPKYRGAAPINWSIINGDSVAGVTTMFTEAGVDTGPMLLKAEVPIGPDMNAEELAHELSHVGAQLLIKTLIGLEDGTVKPEQQDATQATTAPMMNKDLGDINWNKSAQEIHNLVRGLVPWPGTFSVFRGASLKIVRTAIASPGGALPPGTVSVEKSGIIVACGTEGKGRLELVEVQPANKGKVKARDWANGARITPSERLGT